MGSDPENPLGKARAILAQPDVKADQLGIALLYIHSALEEHFRTSLSCNDRVPLETRASLSLSRALNWPELLVLMTTYGGLNTTQGGTIRSMNMIRNGIAHRRETYRGTRQDLLRYADLAESLITRREPSFADAEMPDELFDATMAALGRDAPPKQHTVGETPRSTSLMPTSDVPLLTRQQPASARPRQPAPPRADDAPAVHHNRAASQGAQYSTLLILVLIVVLIWLFFGLIMRDPSQLPQPTPTLGLPTGIIFSPVSPLSASR
jgi:hypothetical protein